MANPGTLYLVPNIIAEGTQQKAIPPYVVEVLKKLNYFLAEDIRTARRYLSSLKIFDSIESLHFSTLNKDTDKNELGDLMKPVLDGQDLGVLSDSGCPAIADPGAMAVDFAHAMSVKVVPLVGPSSILLALMASGLSGQQFCFHGYLPIDSKNATKAIRALERESKAKHQTQIFIETPYRTNALFQRLLGELNADTKLCIALDLTSANEVILTKRVCDWRVGRVAFPKVPAIFMFFA
jgi:16S rRNA (cytidine1402-2'-O)-methyltransferase